MAIRIQSRRDTATNWTNENPTLAQGEIGFEIDTNPFKMKVGDGVNTWADLAYVTSDVMGVFDFLSLNRLSTPPAVSTADTDALFLDSTGKFFRKYTLNGIDTTTVEFIDFETTVYSDFLVNAAALPFLELSTNSAQDVINSGIDTGLFDLDARLDDLERYIFNFSTIGAVESEAALAEVPQTEVKLSFVELVPSSNTDVLVIDEVNDEIDIIIGGRWVYNWMIRATSTNTQDVTVTLLAKDQLGAVSCGEDFVVPGGGGSNTYEFDRNCYIDVEDNTTLELYAVADDSDIELEVYRFAVQLTAGSGVTNLNSQYVTNTDALPSLGTPAGESQDVINAAIDSEFAASGQDIEDLEQAIDDQVLNGFVNGDDVAAAITNTPGVGTPPQVTITFTGTVEYWSNLTRYEKSGTDVITIDDTSGTHLLYYDGPTLSKITGGTAAQFKDIVLTKSLVLVLYWNANSGEVVVFGRETHGCVMSGPTHYRLHEADGAKLISGGELSGFELGVATDAAVSFDVTDSRVLDEDLPLDITNGVASIQYEQVLQGDAEIPVIYRDDVDQSWTEVAASTLPYLIGPGGRIQYQDVENNYALTEVSNRDFCSYWLIFTNDSAYPVKMVPGNQEYSSAIDVRNNAKNELLDLQDLPSPEFVIAYQFVMQDSSGGTKNVEIHEINQATIPRGGSEVTGIPSHASTHSVGGSDPIDFASLEGELDELNDVVITSLLDGQFIKYDSASGNWVNTTSTPGVRTGTRSILGEEVYDSSQTVTAPTGTTHVKITCVGAGGGGAREDNATACGGGGGGAGGTVVYYAAVSGGIAITVGAGGAAASADNETGGGGGDTTCSTYSLTAGGGGGGGRANSGVMERSVGGLGGSASGGNLSNLRGGGGGNAAMGGYGSLSGCGGGAYGAAISGTAGPGCGGAGGNNLAPFAHLPSDGGDGYVGMVFYEVES